MNQIARHICEKHRAYRTRAEAEAAVRWKLSRYWDVDPRLHIWTCEAGGMPHFHLGRDRTGRSREETG